MPRVVVVTGGSQNIGLAIAEGFAAEGAQVIIADIQPPTNSDFIFHETNVADEFSVKSLMAHIESDFGRLDVLVNNAGICIEVPIQDMSTEQWDRVMDINVKGVFLMTKHAFSIMTNGISESPAIVNISSIEGLGANPQHSVYGASKGAVASFTHNTALEYGPHGIRCNAIAPGWINTPFNEKFLNQYPNRAKVDDEIKSLHPVGRLGLPEDIANTALYLASPQAGFITGQEIIVAGGRMAKLPLPKL
ncbi:SDR family NAD(P)-dependent oxidoreductase [Hellea balneolensis]|uniref:SDR family NAD(P)-dependent oxidoreductase n=1 Tax=Hellea balneolensis TaxID=287478 RepID=UPI00040B81EF|nr:SDR family oxidoreductase [Hellea balneolensis]